MDAQFVVTSLGAFLLVVVSLILLHELGHYVTARAFGLVPKAFSVGMGPEIAAFVDRKGTRWKFSAMPLGGYVKFAGEMHPGTGTPEEAAEEHSFASLARWKRACIIFAGPFTNLLVTAVIFLILSFSFGRTEIDSTIRMVTPASAAAEAGVMPGDKVVSWNGQEDPHIQSLIRYVKVHPDEALNITLERHGELVDKSIPIQRAEMRDSFGNRFQVGQVGIEFPMERVPLSGLADIYDVSVVETMRLFGLQSVSMGQIVTGKRSLDEISGPIRMAKMSGEQLSLGWIPLLYFAAIISIAIAFMNLLPVPGLDGGFLALYAVETVTRKNATKATMTKVMRGGYAVIATLMVFAFSNDIRVVFMS